jgi:hypothetical protein
MRGRSSLAAPEAKKLAGEIKRTPLRLDGEVERYLKPPVRDELASTRWTVNIEEA